jgi:hypothetical protein
MLGPLWPKERFIVSASRFARAAGPATSISAAAVYEPVRNTRKTAVANYLLEHEGEWIDAATFNDVGGRAGDRRMRELRQDGWKIETRRVAGNSYQHRLAKAPAKKVQSQYRTVAKAKVAA